MERAVPNRPFLLLTVAPSCADAVIVIVISLVRAEPPVAGSVGLRIFALLRKKVPRTRLGRGC